MKTKVSNYYFIMSSLNICQEIEHKTNEKDVIKCRLDYNYLRQLFLDESWQDVLKINNTDVCTT